MGDLARSSDPARCPTLLTGIRQAVRRGLVGMVAAELFLSASGMGARSLCDRAGTSIRPAFMPRSSSLAILGVVLISLGRKLEERFLGVGGGLTDDRARNRCRTAAALRIPFHFAERCSRYGSPPAS